MRLPRLIATDLDGTVLRRDGTLSERTSRVLRAAAEAGTQTVAVTARPVRFVRALGLTGMAAAVCANGALVCDLASGAVLEEHALPMAAVREVAAALAAAVPGVGFALETGDRVLYAPEFTLRFSEPADTVVEAASADELWACADPVVKLMAYSEDLGNDGLLAAARIAAGGRAQCTHSGGRGLVEMAAPGVTKGSTLAAWCAARGIAAEDVVAFGDAPNDLPMLAWAGTGWAVGNAHPSVLAAVPRHTLSIDEDGVAAVLEPLFAPGAPPFEPSSTPATPETGEPVGA